MNETVKFMLPEGHPWAGQRIIIPAASGATTYNDGEVEFTTPLKEEIRKVREQLNKTTSRMKEKSP